MEVSILILITYFVVSYEIKKMGLWQRKTLLDERQNFDCQHKFVLLSVN